MKSSFLYLLLALVCLFGIISSVPPENHVQRRYKSDCQLSITFAGHIKDSFPCIYKLITDLIIGNKRPYPIDVFNIFCESGNFSLVFIDKKLQDKVAAATGNGYLSIETGKFLDTIFLDRGYFKNGSKEYLISVIFHESIHAFIHWCILSYDYKQNGVNKHFLRRCFPMHWQWLTQKAPYIGEDSQHILMTENYITQLAEAIYKYTNPAVSEERRKGISYSLAWGGLFETPKWKNEVNDTCAVHHVNGWASNINPLNKGFSIGDCDTTPRSFLDELKLRSPCQ